MDTWLCACMYKTIQNNLTMCGSLHVYVSRTYTYVRMYIVMYVYIHRCICIDFILAKTMKDKVF